MYSRIVGTGKYLPERVLTNFDLERMVDTSDEWIRSRTGIVERHIAADDQSTSDLAFEAAAAAIADARIDASDIDLIVVGTTTPDLIFPNVACLVQERLGVRGAPAFSLEAACSGFIYSLGVADQFLRSGQAKRALVIGAETMSRIIDWSDRETCVLFGDGAGAVVLEAADEPGIIYSTLGADGHYRDLLYASSGVSRKRQPDDDSGALKMRGNEVFKVAVKTLETLVDDVIASNGIDKGAISWLIPHQANIRIIKATAKRLGLPMERVVLTVQEHGNTSAASVPLALDTAVKDGRIQRGDLLLLEAFGGGFTWGASLIKF